MDLTEKDDFITKAKLAEQAERYDDMVKAISKVVEEHHSLTPDERNLLSVAYKNVIGARRSAWRTISAEEQKFHEKGEAWQRELAENYRKEIEKELENTCNEILKVLDEHLIGNAADDESKVFYRKMKGDYYRYLAEFSSGDEKKRQAENSNTAYGEAMKDAENLKSTHPIQLGLALNYSVFYYEIMNSPEKACSLAKKTFEDAIAELDSVTDDSYKDSTLILQLLRDNLTLWTADSVAGDVKVEDVDEDQQEDS